MTTADKSKAAIAEMLIRRPVAEVFEAFINPEITTKFWFTKSSGRLEAGKQIYWTWEMYNATGSVLVKAIEPNKRILIEWGDPNARTIAEWTFKEIDEASTFVSIVNSGFVGTSDELLSWVRDSTGGFTIVLAGLKAYLEHHIELNLIGDRFPQGK